MMTTTSAEIASFYDDFVLSAAAAAADDDDDCQSVQVLIQILSHWRTTHWHTHTLDKQ